MAYRESVNSGIDQRVFNRTARSVKKINVSPRIMRGGIRL